MTGKDVEVSEIFAVGITVEPRDELMPDGGTLLLNCDVVEIVLFVLLIDEAVGVIGVRTELADMAAVTEDVLPPTGASDSVNETPVLDALVLVIGLEYVVSETRTELPVIFEVELADDEIRPVDETEPVVLFGKTGMLLGITADTDDEIDTVGEEICADDDE